MSNNFATYADLLLNRLEYMSLSDRLSPESQRELHRVGEVLRSLRESFPEDEPLSTPKVHSARFWLANAYRAELDRYSKLVLADARATRSQSAKLRVKAQRLRELSGVGAGPRLRIVRDPGPIGLEMLAGMVERAHEAAG